MVDLQGRIVRDFGEKQVDKGTQRLAFEAQGLTKGTYFMQAAFGDGVSIGKIILN
ncbi:MAG: hypothetical protein IPN76_26845 [Saprospiraceae bacterium]|nr:hypothetical protein [Saprospiraceae bacterium]